MLRRAGRWIVLLVLAAALASTVLMAARIASDPSLSPNQPATVPEIQANVQAQMAEQATAQAIDTRLRQLLGDAPRNWLSLALLTGFAESQGIALPADITDALAIAQEDDFGLYAFAAPCATCAIDPAQCPFAQHLICNAALELPGPADLPTLAAAARDGSARNQAELALAIAALHAESLAPLTGGQAEDIRRGASFATLGLQLSRLSPALTTLASDAALDGVNWGALTNMAAPQDLAAAAHPQAFAPLARALLALDQLYAARTPKMALQLLPMVDTPDDALQLTSAVQALGPDVIVAAELLGRDNLLRATRSLSKTAWITVAGLAASWVSLAVLAVGWLRRRADRRLEENVE